jgi:hypothetical protein
MTWVTPRLAILVPTFSKLQACFKTPPTTKTLLEENRAFY